MATDDEVIWTYCGKPVREMGEVELYDTVVELCEYAQSLQNELSTARTEITNLLKMGRAGKGTDFKDHG